MAGHTPGPWEAEICRYRPDLPAFGFAINAPGKIPPLASAGIAPSSHALIVGEEYRKHVTTGYTEEEVEANARLIAAAPDLLEACVRILHAIDRDDYAVVHQVSAAIWKATQDSNLSCGVLEPVSK